jgi:hypothetical protein
MSQDLSISRGAPDHAANNSKQRGRCASGRAIVKASLQVLGAGLPDPPRAAAGTASHPVMSSGMIKFTIAGEVL